MLVITQTHAWSCVKKKIYYFKTTHNDTSTRNIKGELFFEGTKPSHKPSPLTPNYLNSLPIPLYREYETPHNTDNDTYLSNNIYCRHEKLARFSRLFSYLKFGCFMGDGIADGESTLAHHIVMENKSADAV